MWKFWQLINDNLYYDQRVGNYWTIQEAHALYLLRWIELAERDLIK
jgi:hypothetical protein